MNYPDLPLIRWDVFISRVRIRWAHGICPESFSPPTAESLEGTDNVYRKQKSMKASKPKPKPAKKGSKGSEKSEKGCGKKC